MGRFLAIVALLAGCGDNLDSGTIGPGHHDDDVDPANTGSIVPRYTPQVCGVKSWDANIGDVAMDISVVPHPEGAAVLAVPEGGGTMIGYMLDTRMESLGGGSKISLQSDFGQVSGALINDRVVATTVQDGSVYVNLLDENLANPQWTAKLPGMYTGETAFVHTQADLVMPVVGDNGLTLYRFDDSLEPLDSKLVLQTKPATSMTTAQLGAATMTAWSTEGECYMMMNSTYYPGPYARVGSPCNSPRLALNQTTGEGAMVFETIDGVRLMNVWASQMGGDSRVLRETSTSPRVIFDGAQFWISYLDARGDLIVGFLDANRHLISMSLGESPQANAYELAMVLGSPYVFAAGPTGYTAHKMCVEAQW